MKESLFKLDNFLDAHAEILWCSSTNKNNNNRIRLSIVVIPYDDTFYYRISVDGNVEAIFNKFATALKYFNEKLEE